VPQGRTRVILKCAKVIENKGVDAISAGTDRKLSKKHRMPHGQELPTSSEKPARAQLHKLFYDRTCNISMYNSLSTFLRTVGEAGFQPNVRQIDVCTEHCSMKNFA
jgi:hypothetical protein